MEFKYKFNIVTIFLLILTGTSLEYGVKGGGSVSQYSSSSASASAHSSAFSSSYTSGNIDDLPKLSIPKASAVVAASAKAELGGVSAGALAGASASAGTSSGTLTGSGIAGGGTGSTTGIDDALESGTGAESESLTGGSSTGSADINVAGDLKSNLVNDLVGNVGVKKKQCCQGPFPGPSGSIHDYKAVGDSGATSVVGVGPLPTKIPSSTVVYSGSLDHSTSLPVSSGSNYGNKPISSGSVSSASFGSGQSLIGSSISILSSFPGPSGSIYDSKPAVNVPSTSSVSGGSYGGSHSSASSGSVVNSGIISSFPGPSGSIYDHKPVTTAPSTPKGSYNSGAHSSSVANTGVLPHIPSTPSTSVIYESYDVSKIPTTSSTFGTTSPIFPGPSGSIYDHKQVTKAPSVPASYGTSDSTSNAGATSSGTDSSAFPGPSGGILDYKPVSNVPISYGSSAHGATNAGANAASSTISGSSNSVTNTPFTSSGTGSYGGSHNNAGSDSISVQNSNFRPPCCKTFIPKESSDRDFTILKKPSQSTTFSFSTPQFPKPSPYDSKPQIPSGSPIKPFVSVVPVIPVAPAAVHPSGSTYIKPQVNNNNIPITTVVSPGCSGSSCVKPTLSTLPSSGYFSSGSKIDSGSRIHYSGESLLPHPTKGTYWDGYLVTKPDTDKDELKVVGCTSGSCGSSTTTGSGISSSIGYKPSTIGVSPTNSYFSTHDSKSGSTTYNSITSSKSDDDLAPLTVPTSSTGGYNSAVSFASASADADGAGSASGSTIGSHNLNEKYISGSNYGLNVPQTVVKPGITFGVQVHKPGSYSGSQGGSGIDYDSLGSYNSNDGGSIDSHGSYGGKKEVLSSSIAASSSGTQSGLSDGSGFVHGLIKDLKENISKAGSFSSSLSDVKGASAHAGASSYSSGGSSFSGSYSSASSGAHAYSSASSSAGAGHY